MSFLATSKKLVNSKLFYSLAAAGSVFGLAMSYTSLSTPVLNEQQKTFTGDGQWIDLKLVKSWDVSHNTKHFLFSLPSPDQVSGLETASCLLTKFKENKEGGKNIIRPYTPISPVDQKGEIELVIKKYEDGKMSNHLFGMKPNDTLSFKGPILKWKWEPNQFKEIALIGAGTGITPLYQLLHEISRNPDDKTKVTLFYGNIAPEDVLIKKEIDLIANKNPDQIKVNYFVDKPVADWYGHTGFITVDFLKSHLPKPSSDVKIFVCGPPPFYKALSGTKVSPSDQGEVSGALAQLGFSKDQVYKF